MSIKKHIPNTLTCCNLISGCIATSFALAGNARLALLWIIVGAVFDFFDGMSARLLGVSSPIGKELDSLADDVTFGVAPAAIVFSELYVMQYPSFLQPLCCYIPFLAFLIAAFSGLRLAKFNLDERQTTSFIGLPTPANALFWGSLVVYNPGWLEGYSWSVVVILLLIGLSCYLLIAELPMFALKFKHWSFKGNEVKYCFALLTLTVFIVEVAGNGWEGLLTGWWVVILAYIFVSIGCTTMAGKGKWQQEVNDKKEQ